MGEREEREREGERERETEAGPKVTNDCRLCLPCRDPLVPEAETVLQFLPSEETKIGTRAPK